MAYYHGIYWTEVPTSLSTPQTADAAFPVIVGTAPIFKASKGEKSINVPILCYTFSEAYEKLGYSDDWDKWTLCEAMYVYFQLYKVAPVCFINVYNPSELSAVEVHAAQQMSVSNKRIELPADTIPATVSVKQISDENTVYVLGSDYTLSWKSTGEMIISIMPGGSIPAETVNLSVGYSTAKPDCITATDIIGGIDANTGKSTGWELIEEVFPRFRLTPGILLSPKWSSDPSVAAVMAAKARNINGVFKAISFADIPDTEQYTDAPAWKNTNNYVDEFQCVTYPKVALGDKKFHLSTQAAALIAQTDAEGSTVGAPYISPSNHKLQMDSCIYGDDELMLGLEQANYLDSNGISTALNWIGGWRMWGNHTAAYPSNTDPKDYFIPIRRMFNWIGNSIVLTFWNKVDRPLNKILIDNVVDTVNIWFDGLASSGYIAGGRLVFSPDENTELDLMSGKATFHIYVCPFSPAQDFHFVLEYDSSYLQNLFK